MRNVLVLIAALGSAPALAETPGPSPAQALLEGSWRYAVFGAETPACGEAPTDATRMMAFEFAATGGRLSFDSESGAREDVFFTVKEAGPARVVLVLQAPYEGEVAFQPTGEDRLTPEAGVPMFEGLDVKTLIKCAPPADRTAIVPGETGLAYLSARLTPEEGPRFVDKRSHKNPQKLCEAEEAQYVFFDLTGPGQPVMGRWNSYGLQYAAESGAKLSFQPDEVSNWTIDAMAPVPNGWRLTITELIPPNGARGDTTSITVMHKENAMWIAEWKREYWRCTTGGDVEGD